ncbi:histidine kinase, partial [Rathayibacter sp. VKM Ac-2928]|nr:histidine kinase [Rathayibacter sp. VKM Ac-2928]
MPGTSPRGSIAARLFAVQLICILVIGAIAVLVLAFDARGRAGDDAAQRSLVVARTVADNPFVLDAAQGADPSASLQPYAEEIMADTGVDFLTIMNPDRTRYTHRDRAQIGLPFIGTIAPALEGRTFTETYTGTLGPSVRAVAPIESADGTVVALVSAGVTLSRVDASFLPRLQVVAGGVLGAVALGGIGSWLLARYLRRVTGGRGPEQMSQVFA